MSQALRSRTPRSAATALFDVVLGACAVLVLGGGLVAISWVLWRAVGWLLASGQIAPAIEQGIARVSLTSLLSSTLVISVLALAIAAPLGILAATHLEECAPSARRRLLGALHVVAAWPALVFAAPVLWLAHHSLGVAPNGWVAGGALGLLISAPIAAVCAEALRAVPRQLRDQTIALGARPRAVTWRVLIPAARGGVAAAIVLGALRAAGESAFLALLVGGAARGPFPLAGPTDTLASFPIRAQPASLVAEGPAYGVVFACAGLLLLWTWLLAGLGRRASRRLLRPEAS